MKHITPPFWVSNSGAQYVDNLKECRKQIENEYGSVVEEPLRVSWNGRIRNRLVTSISKSMGFFNQN
jgi:hypothetical protein